MIPETFDRETALDLVVNAVPLAILTSFVLLFVLDTPYGIDPVATATQLTLVLVPLGALVILSYYAASAVEGAEAEMEADTDTAVEAEADADVADAEADATPDTDTSAAVADGTETGDTTEEPA